MSDYIITPSGELMHHGIKGMRWGVRRFQRKDGTRTPAGKRRLQDIQNETDSKKSVKSSSGNSSKKANYQKAVKVGAAAVGTILATYGTYKVAKFVQSKRSEKAMAKASDYISKNFMNKIGESNFSNGQTISNFANKTGTRMVVKGRGSREIGKHNAQVVSTGRQMHKDATNTRLDRGLSKVVGAGDAAGNAAKRAGSAAGRTATTAKNRVLDVVNPLYEYIPGNTTTTVRNINGLKVTENVTDLRKRRVRR